MPIPLSLYIHIPWCVKKCLYCDFNSHTSKSNLPEQAYINSLLIDLNSDLERFDEHRPLVSIFIGGGTPSLLSGNAIKRLLDGVNRLCPFSDSIEITLEANPGKVNELNFLDYYNSGVNRLSIGIQSFNNKQLQKLGRIHQAQDAIRAVKIAQDIGFDNINIDIMFGLPQQTLKNAINDITRAICLDTKHLSYYQLTLEPNTVFASYPPCDIPSEENIDLYFKTTSQLLRESKFHRYEVSSWSRKKQSQHNLNYWEYGDYLGIGAGAHGKITVLNKDNKNGCLGEIVRTTKTRSPKKYMEYHQRSERIVTDKEKPVEFMLNTLRLLDGFPRKFIKQRGLIEEDSIMTTLEQLANKNLLQINKQYIYPTSLGKRFINDMITEFL